MTKANKKAVIVRNTAVLFTALMITKFVGAALKIPLANILGGIGMGYFSTAYSVFSPVYALFAAGIPTVVTRLVAQNYSCKRYGDVKTIKRAAFAVSLALGFLGTAVVIAAAFPFSYLISGETASGMSVMAIAPSVLFCCVTSAVRGYFEGFGNMYPTAISQVMEATVKAVLGLSFSAVTLSVMTERLGDEALALPYAAAAAIAGVSLSEMTGTVFVCIRAKFPDGISRDMLRASAPRCSQPAFMKRIFTESIPISVSAVVTNLSGFIDLMTIAPLINNSVINNTDYFIREFVCKHAPDVALSEIGTFIYGTYTGIVASLFGFVPAVTALFGKSSLPHICAAFERKRFSEAMKYIKLLIFSSTVISGAAGIALGTFAEPVLNFLYSSRPAEAFASVMPFRILSYGGFSLALAGALFVIFQAIGRADIPLKQMLFSAGMKLVLNYTLVGIPELNISGAAVSTVLSYFVSDIIGLVILAGIFRHNRSGERI